MQANSGYFSDDEKKIECMFSMPLFASSDNVIDFLALFEPTLASETFTREHKSSSVFLIFGESRSGAWRKASNRTKASSMGTPMLKVTPGRWSKVFFNRTVGSSTDISDLFAMMLIRLIPASLFEQYYAFKISPRDTEICNHIPQHIYMIRCDMIRSKYLSPAPLARGDSVHPQTMERVTRFGLSYSGADVGNRKRSK